MKMHKRIKTIAKTIENEDGRLYLVGGAVRDQIRGVEPKDFDFCIVGITEEKAKQIVSLLLQDECINVISNAPVFTCAGFEFAMARIETQESSGKGGFTFVSSPSVTLLQDLKRRDFTAGAIAQDILTGEIIDPFHGRRDIEFGELRCVDSETFIQSPERVFRGLTQSARFGWYIGNETMDCMKSMKKDFDTIPVEQIWLHLEKAGKELNKETWRFVLGLDSCGWSKFFPEIRINDAYRAVRDNCDETEDKVEWFVASLMAKMSSKQRNSFLDRINAPNRIKRVATEFCVFGGHKPAPLVTGKDLFHLVDPSPELGILVKKVFDKQISNNNLNKQELVLFAEQIMEK